MAYSMCTSEAIINKAGKYKSLAASGAIVEQASEEAEGFINGATRFNWNAASAAITADCIGILKRTCSALGAMNLITYDMSGYTNQLEAQTMLDVLRDQANAGIQFLKEIKNKDFINGA